MTPDIEGNEEDEFGINVEDVKDFKMNDISCTKCGESLGCMSEQVLASVLCNDCFDILEQQYKKLHPEEYSDD